MALLWVTEYASVDVIEGNSVVPALVWPPIATQVIDYSGGAAATSNALNENTSYVRLFCDVGCHAVVAASDATAATVATTSVEPIGAGVGEIRRLRGDVTGRKIFAVAAA